MLNLKKAASVFVLTLAASTAAMAGTGGDDHYYPENPNPGHPHHGQTHNNNNNLNLNGNTNNNGNYNRNNNANNNNNANRNNNNNANNSNASADANASANAVTNATQNLTADQKQLLNAKLSQGNSQTVNGGATTVQTGATTMNNTTNYEAPKTFGNVAPIVIQPTGQCGSGFGVNISTMGFGAGFGGSKQSITCLSAEAARVMMEEGRALGDKGMIAVGAATYRRLYPEVNEASHSVILTLRQSCWKRAAETSVILLTGDAKNNDALECDGEYVKGTREAAQRAEAALRAKAEADARAVDHVLDLMRKVNEAKPAVDVSANTVSRYAVKHHKAPLQKAAENVPCLCKN